MSKVNKVPFGLQDFLGSQNFGKNPTELSQVIAPTLDLFPFLAIDDYLTQITGQSIITGESVFATLVVPVGELWFLDTVGFKAQWNTGGQAAGDGCNFSVSVGAVPSNVAGQETVISSVFRFRTLNVGSVTSAEYHGHQLDRLVPLKGDEILQFQASDVSLTGASDIAVRGHCRYYKLKI